MSSTPDTEFDQWFSDTHGGSTPEWEEELDADECVEDQFDDIDEY